MAFLFVSGIVMRIVDSEGRALAEWCGLIEECHVARHINFEGVIAIFVNDFLQYVRDVGCEVWAGE